MKEYYKKDVHNRQSIEEASSLSRQEMLCITSKQSEIVIKQLMLNNNLQRTEATDLWYKSKTKKEIERRKLTYVSGMRCYFELIQEIENNTNWMKEPFHM